MCFDLTEIEEDIRDAVLFPADIGMWVSYAPYHSEEQLQLQKENLLELPLINGYGPVRYIHSKNIDRMEQFLEEISKQIKIQDTKTVLETEVYYTSKIEGAKTTRKRTSEIHNGMPISEDNKFSESMLKGNFEAVKLLNLYGNRLTEEILLKVWNTLVKDCCANEEIRGVKYRIGEVTVTGSEFQAVRCEQIEEAINKLLVFYESDLLKDVPFVKAAIIHFVFETIHPFCDGNGRMGRLLMNNFLLSQGIDSARAVSFSMQIDKKRGLYDGAFLNGENEYGDCTPFVEYMLQTMSDAYLEAKRVMREEGGE